MALENVKKGDKVCLHFKGVPWCNTTVTSEPFKQYGSMHVWLDGVDEPMSLKELYPYNTGVIDTKMKEVNPIK